MQTNAVLIVQKTSKGDISGNTVYTPLGSTYITLMGGKITVRSPLGNQSPEPRLGECSVAIRNFLNMRLLRALTGVN